MDMTQLQPSESSSSLFH